MSTNVVAHWLATLLSLCIVASELLVGQLSSILLPSRLLIHTTRRIERGFQNVYSLGSLKAEWGQQKMFLRRMCLCTRLLVRCGGS